MAALLHNLYIHAQLSFTAITLDAYLMVERRLTK